MKFLLNLLGVLRFRPQSLHSLAEERAIIRGVVFLSIGFLSFVIVRNSVYAPLLVAGKLQPNLVDSFLQLNLIQAVLFLLLVYIPALVILSNSISGNGLGFSISKEEYQIHVSALLPLWGLLLLASTPLQWLVPQFLVIGIFGISIGLFALGILILIYTVWAIKQLNYVSAATAFAVFSLSSFTLPLFWVLTAFVFALPFFVLIPLLYMGYQWLRTYFAARSGGRDFQRQLQILTLNPQDADAHYQLGLIQLKRRNLEAARKHFADALEIDPSDPDYHYFLGRAFEMKEEWADALEQYEQTYNLNPEYGLGDIFREVGKGYLHNGRVDKSIEFLKYFLGNRGSDPEGRYWLAAALRERGDMEQMRFQLNTILEQSRSNPRFFRKENREWVHRARTLLRNSRRSQPAGTSWQ